MKDVVLKWDQFALNVLKKELERRNPKNYQWKTRNGTILDVKDMKDSHLKNVINILVKDLNNREILLENWVDATDYYD